MSPRWFAAAGFVLAWPMLTGSWTPANSLLALLVGCGAAWLLPQAMADGRRVGVRIGPLLRLAALFALELLRSGLRVARVVSARRIDVRPVLFEFPLRLDRPGPVALLANLITLTPGTLTVDVSPDGRALLIHALDAADVDEARRDIRDGFEQLILEAFIDSGRTE